MAKTYTTWIAIAKAIGISRDKLNKHVNNHGWPHPPWTEKQVADAMDQIEGLRAINPNDLSSNNTASLMVKGKLKFLAEKIKQLETANKVQAETLVPKDAVAAGRLEVIQAFKGMFDAIESRAYELVGLNEAEIVAIVGRWRDEFYRTIRYDKAHENQAGPQG